MVQQHFSSKSTWYTNKFVKLLHDEEAYKNYESTTKDITVCSHHSTFCLVTSLGFFCVQKWTETTLKLNCNLKMLLEYQNMKQKIRIALIL